MLKLGEKSTSGERDLKHELSQVRVGHRNMILVGQVRRELQWASSGGTVVCDTGVKVDCKYGEQDL